MLNSIRWRKPQSSLLIGAKEPRARAPHQSETLMVFGGRWIPRTYGRVPGSRFFRAEAAKSSSSKIAITTPARSGSTRYRMRPVACMTLWRMRSRAFARRWFTGGASSTVTEYSRSSHTLHRVWRFESSRIELRLIDGPWVPDFSESYPPPEGWHVGDLGGGCRRRGRRLPPSRLLQLGSLQGSQPRRMELGLGRPQPAPGHAADGVDHLLEGIPPVGLGGPAGALHRTPGSPLDRRATALQLADRRVRMARRRPDAQRRHQRSNTAAPGHPAEPRGDGPRLRSRPAC